MPYTMPSSSRPYQSKLLRFVLQQWQQGWERQDRAFRQLQTTATWSAQAAVLPLYAIMRAVKRASFTLGSGSKAPAPEITPAHTNVTDIDHSLTAILTHTHQLLSPQQTEQLGFPKETSPLLHKAQRVLAQLLGKVRPPAKRATAHGGPLSPVKKGSSKIVSQSGGRPQPLATRASELSTNKKTAALVQQGTTLASSLKTRQLVLVNLKNEVFDIFTPAQQKDLQHYIERVMYAYGQTRTIVVRKTKQFSAKTIFTIGGVFIGALSFEFRKAWEQLAPGAQEPNLPVISDTSKPQARVFYPQTVAQKTVRTRAKRLQTKSTERKKHKRISSKAPHAFEANVNDVSYLEHPLERILRLLDRVLSWCEHRLQKWMEHRTG